MIVTPGDSPGRLHWEIEMVERSKLNGKVETCRPAMGAGVPVEPGNALVDPSTVPTAKVVVSESLKQHIKSEVIRSLALQTACSLVLGNVSLVASVMGLSPDDVVAVLHEVALRYPRPAEPGAEPSEPAPQG